MSAKWRALQHRHRYTYNAVVFPQPYTDSLQNVNFPNGSFFSELKELTLLNSIYAQVNHVKKVASSFTETLLNQNDEEMVSKVVKLYLEVMFFENSLPLHRTLLSALAKVRKYQGLVRECFRGLCEEYAGHRNPVKRFCVSRAMLSIMGMPKLGYLVDIVEDCAVLVCWDTVDGLNGVILETKGWARPSPLVMEQCQEALSCLYYLLQRFPSKFKNVDGGNAMEMVFTVVLSVLVMPSFSRDCYVAAGVSFCAALQVCLSPQELGWSIIEGIFGYRSNCSSDTGCESKLGELISKVPFKGDLYNEIQNFSLLSRLCLIRGILTVVSRTVLNMPFVKANENSQDPDCYGLVNKSVKTILYDGILPELCNYCENPSDSHFNFHALTVMQICLQQIKTSMLGNVDPLPEDYEPIQEETGSRILRIIWNNLEDPLSQTVKQVHLIFDLFLDIQSTLQWEEGGGKIKLFLRKIALDLLRMGPRCKGRYVPLAALTRRLGAKCMLNMNPDLIFETATAYLDDDVCSAATSFLKCFLENLRNECWTDDGVERGYATYRAHCLAPFLHGLASGISKLRTNLNTYALPVLLEVDVESIFSMLAFISVFPSGDDSMVLYSEINGTCVELSTEQNVSILVSLLKVSRIVALLEGDIDWFEKYVVPKKEDRLKEECVSCYALIHIKGIKMKVPVEWLALALTHADESLRVEAAEFLLLNPKTASLPSHLELSLMKEAIPLNMRSCSTAFQMKWGSLFRKFFNRVRTALEKQFKQHSWMPFATQNGSERCLQNEIENETGRADALFDFIQWMSSFLFLSCYPSAPYKRKIMAMELLLIMIDVWPINSASRGKTDSSSSECCIHPYSKGITSPDSTFLLVGSIIDSWDRLRESSFRILLHFPTPLPGLSHEDRVARTIEWAKRLVCSPRVRESDAGALALRLIFRKYVVELGWMVGASVNVVCQSCYPINNGNHKILSRHPVANYIRSLIDWLDVVVGEGEKDLAAACSNSFVHGLLLALRYTFEELDWNSIAFSSSIPEMRNALEKLFELVLRITSLALWVVSADAWYLPEDMDEIVDDDSFMLGVEDEMCDTTNDAEYNQSSKAGRDIKTSEQIVMVGCWLAMKEVSLLLGTIIRKVPLLSVSFSNSADAKDDVSMVSNSDAVLNLKQLEAMGNHFLEVLLKMKHNGAIDKTRAGFTALCNRLLCSNDPRLCKLTETWMEQLMERMVAKGQVVDDVLRRSAGIPAAFIALFLAEPQGVPKKLLARALRWLIDVASTTLKNLGTTSSSISTINLEQVADSVSNLDQNKSGNSSKIRDEGVIPTVHAFNVLRTAFNDTNLATDTSGFSAEALMVSICAFSSPYWEVRNSACLAFTALVRRMIGFLNVHKRESARRAITGLEFFHRYPSLHSFLFNELKVAMESPSDEPSRRSERNIGKAVHPSLCPVLILLSRLKPSTIASEVGDELDPFLFMPLIQRCSTQCNMKIRILASRALTGLVSNEKLPTVLIDMATELHSALSIFLSPENGNNHATFNSIHGMLLQINSLLDTNCRNLADPSKKNQILNDLIKVIEKSSWIGSPKQCPCPVLNTSFLQMLDHMHCIARTCNSSNNSTAIQNLLLKLTTDCLDLEVCCGLPYYDPTTSELREQATASYFSCFFQTSTDTPEENLQLAWKGNASCLNLSFLGVERVDGKLQERLIQSLADSSYEVRLVTLKWLFKFLKTMESRNDGHDFSSGEMTATQHWAEANLQSTMIDHLYVERYHKCTYYILRIFFTWNALHYKKVDGKSCNMVHFVGLMDYESLLDLWNKLVSLYEVVKHTKSREMLICCLGICVKRLASLFTSSALESVGKTINIDDRLHQFGILRRIYECICWFVQLIKQHSASSEPLNMRKAATEALIASGMLVQAELMGSSVSSNKIPSGCSSLEFDPKESINLYAHQILSTWLTCIRLLEDEDDEIRHRLARDVQKCFASRTPLNRYTGGCVPTQVEKVIELSFGYLSSVFGHWLEYFNYVCQLVHDLATYDISEGDLVRRVFEKEIDNHHEEKLLICQICCFYMEKLSISNSWSLSDENIWDYVHAWRTKYWHQLREFTKYHSTRGSVDWIGGIGNHKDAFLSLYAYLLGFYALSNSLLTDTTRDVSHLAADVAELGKSLSPFLRNPQILNLHMLIVKSHETAGTDIDLSIPEFGADVSKWASFDPYFLLR